MFCRKSAGDRFNVLVFLSLFFAWLGDIFLQLVHLDKNWFLMGLFAFLIAHVFYIVIYMMDQPKHEQLTWGNRMYLHLVYYGTQFFFVNYLASSLPKKLFMPVVAYSTVLISMGRLCWLRFGHVGKKSFYCVAVGAILFIISDLCIALFKFKFGKRWYRDLTIMPTYCIG